MHRFLSIILIITIFGCTRIFSQSVAYYNLVDKADKAANEGKWADAEEALRSALRLEPSNPTNILLLSNLGMIQFYDGRPEEALATLNDAHRIAPNSVTILLNRGRILTALNHDLKAQADYSEALRLDSTLVEPRFYRAMIALNRGDRAHAIADIDTLASRAPEDRLTNVAQATLFIQDGHWKEALPHLNKAIRLQPDASYYASRALCRMMTDDPAGAADDIALGLELDPTDGELYLYRAMLNKLRYRPDDARSDADKAIMFGIDPARVKAIIN